MGGNPRDDNTQSQRHPRQRMHVMGYHMPFPGLGHVVSQGGDAYRWVPKPWA